MIKISQQFIDLTHIVHPNLKQGERNATKNDSKTLLNFGVITFGSCYSKMVYNPQIPSVTKFKPML